MREYAKKPESKSRTLGSDPRASRQAPIDVILQRYKERNIQRYTSAGQEPIQQEVEPNNTGLPDNLKIGVENISGYSMNDVNVHYNSDKPAQINALAYTQGTDIHVAPGQEKHLPHEAWHVIQQKQGRVQPTMQFHGINVNDNEGLEREADILGEKAVIQCVIPNAAQINRWRQNPARYFNHGDILFASVYDEKVGSIYFPNGRMRLTHEKGPTIDVYLGNIARYAITNPETVRKVLKRKSAYDLWLKAGRTFEERVNFLDLQQDFARALDNGILFEIFDDAWYHHHISRGVPERVNFNFNSESFNLLYNAVNSNDNEALVHAMDSDSILREIPIDRFGF